MKATIVDRKKSSEKKEIVTAIIPIVVKRDVWIFIEPFCFLQLS